jgi:hypothetical protein
MDTISERHEPGIRKEERCKRAGAFEVVQYNVLAVVVLYEGYLDIT